ncbi:S-adenosyl-L-methionine-dependent methyltransferase, partial [Sporodiniella umbellata]
MSKDNWSSNNYSKHASFVPKLGFTILDILNPQQDEHILDFGCGDGVLTAELARQCKTVVGIDASEQMILKALRHDNIAYFVVDGHEADKWFEETRQAPFDAVFSNATLHWLKRDPAKVIRSIHHTLKPSGRFVAEFGGFMNCADVQNALINALNKRHLDGQSYSPWFFPSTDTYKNLLT